MTTLEDQLRSTLRTRAAAVAARPDEGAVQRRVQQRRRRRQVVPAVGAAAAIVAAVVVVAQQGDPAGHTSTAAGGEAGAAEATLPVSASATGSERVRVVLPGWMTARFQTFGPRPVTPADLADEAASTDVVDVEYEFVDGARRLQLHTYAGGVEMYRWRTDGESRTTVTALGADASLLDYGSGRYRVDVLVGDHTWEFDGEPFASAEDFLAALDAVGLVDHAAWQQSLATADVSHVTVDGAPATGNATAEAQTAPPSPGSDSPTTAPPAK